MALWKKKARKRKAPPSTAITSTTAPQKQRKLFSPEVKLLAVKALEAGLTPAGKGSLQWFAGFVQFLALRYCSEPVIRYY